MSDRLAFASSCSSAAACFSGSKVKLSVGTQQGRKEKIVRRLLASSSTARCAISRLGFQNNSRNSNKKKHGIGSGGRRKLLESGSGVSSSFLGCLHERHQDHIQRDYQTPGTLESFLARMKEGQQSKRSKLDVAQQDGKKREDEEGYVVHLVGTGPGDPELLTLKAVRLMQQADVVLYDRLISSEVLEYVNKECLMVYVGKERGLHTRSQTEIHQLLYEFCTAGATVVRLKGGDPYVFGRGGEELEYLQERGVDVKCVPGITAASGISSALGIPLTHRGIADNVQFITGHLRGEFTDEKLKELAHKVAYENTTIVIYMGLNSLPQMSLELVEHGMDPRTAAVAVERGTMKNQRTVFAPLEDLTERVGEAQLESPTLIVIGNVVTLCPLWQEKRVAASSVDSSKAAKAINSAEEKKEGEEEEEGSLLV